MKRAILLGLIGVILLIPSASKVQAASCEATDQPTASLDIPVLPQAGNFNIWTRMQVPDAANIRFQLEVNGESCYLVFHDGVVNQWVWVNTHGTRASASKVQHNFTRPDGNKLKLIALDDGIKIDRLLLLQNDCVPEGTGDNCRAGATSLPVQPATASISQTPSDAVSGKVFVAALLTQTSKDVDKVQYFSDGRKVQESLGIAPLDTTLVSNGVHTITTRIFWSDGTSEDVINTITVRNSVTTFSPVIRWMRLNQKPLAIAGTVLGATSISLFVLWTMRSLHARRVSRRLHGF